MGLPVVTLGSMTQDPGECHWWSLCVIRPRRMAFWKLQKDSTFVRSFTNQGRRGKNNYRTTKKGSPVCQSDGASGSTVCPGASIESELLLQWRSEWRTSHSQINFIPAPEGTERSRADPGRDRSSAHQILYKSRKLERGTDSFQTVIWLIKFFAIFVRESTKYELMKRRRWKPSKLSPWESYSLPDCWIGRQNECGRIVW